MDLIRLVTGVDPVGLFLDMSCGDSLGRLDLAYAGAAAIRFMTPPADGVLTAVRGVPTALGLDGVEEVEVTDAYARAVRRAESDYDYLGHVIASGPDARTAQRRADRAADAIEFVIDTRG
jgi:S-sulfo-L-cysteine synthase (3-phospho-L-serine-dependent)